MLSESAEGLPRSKRRWAATPLGLLDVGGLTQGWTAGNKEAVQPWAGGRNPFGIVQQPWAGGRQARTIYLPRREEREDTGAPMLSQLRSNGGWPKCRSAPVLRRSEFETPEGTNEGER